MPDVNRPNSIEDKLHAATRMPEPRAEFLAGLRSQWSVLAAVPRRQTWVERLGASLRGPVLVTVLVVAILVLGWLAVVGPQRVAAAIGSLFGYIPGEGMVAQNAPLRVLAEPVSATRDGVSLRVTSALLSGDKTRIEYTLFGVPRSAYPDREDIVGCMQAQVLRLPDGTKLVGFNDFPPVPANVNEAVLEIPCIANTLPGKAPENWELPLRFIAAPPDLTVMPVVDLPTPHMQTTRVAAPTAVGATPLAQINEVVTVDKVVEMPDGYILIGKIHPQTQPGAQGALTGMPSIRDANGKKVAYSIPRDISPDSDEGHNIFGWDAQIQAAGLAYPLTISFPGVEISPADANAKAEFEFDAGAAPQMGQEWKPNVEVSLAGHTIQVESIRADSRQGYSFQFKSDAKVSSASVEIEGHPAVGGGGGGAVDGTWSASLAFTQMPTGKLKVIIGNLQVTSDALTWQGQWTPAVVRSDWPATATPQAGLCLSADALEQLAPLPADLGSGKVVFYAQLADGGEWGIGTANLDGSQKETVALKASWGALSVDGSQVAYPVDGGIRIRNLAGKSERTLPSAEVGYNLRWSPDGKQIAFINNNASQVLSINTEDATVHKLSDQSYASVIGWSADSREVLIAVRSMAGAAWKIQAVPAPGVPGAARDLFTIENGSLKQLSATLSPDGAWIAYRGRDNGSLYLVRVDGSDGRLVIDNPNGGISGLAWSQTGWLGVSRLNLETMKESMMVLQPDGCKAYALPEVKGSLEGLFVP
jgi:hypothetical protein